MPSEDNYGLVLRQIVRGEVSPTYGLGRARVSVCFTIDGIEVERAEPVGTQASMSDVAKGLLHHWSSPIDLQDWATAVLTLVEFPPFPWTAQTVALMDGVWDACLGNPVNLGALQGAHRLVT